MSTLTEQAQRRVADGTAGSVESALWSITYQAGYAHGRSDAHNGTIRGLEGATEGYAAGYTRGYRWTLDHPLPPALRGVADLITVIEDSSEEER